MEFLQKQNKNYENQIKDIKNMIELIKKKSSDDKSKFNEFVAQVIQLKENLSKELKEVQQIKKELAIEEESENKKGKKTQLVMSGNNIISLNEMDNDSNSDKEDYNQQENIIDEPSSSSDSKGPSSSSIGDMSSSIKKNKFEEKRAESQFTENKNVRDNSKNKNKTKSKISSSSISSNSVK